MHLSLLDVNHDLIAVELFSSFIEELDGTVLHLVGIKEVVEDEPWQVSVRNSSHLDMNSAPEIGRTVFPSDLRVQSQMTSIQRVPEKSLCNSSDHGSSSSIGSVADIVCTCALANMDAIGLSIPLPIIDHNISFAMLFGPSFRKGMDLFKWISVLYSVRFGFIPMSNRSSRFDSI